MDDYESVGESFGANEGYIVVSEHEGKEGRYYRLSPPLSREGALSRAKWMIEESGAIKTTLAKAETTFERRYNSVEVPVRSGIGGSLAGVESQRISTSNAKI